MAFASPARKENSASKKPAKNNSTNIMDTRINPDITNHHRTFSQEIPNEFKYTGFSGALGKLKFWDKSARDRWSIGHRLSWDKIPEDAEKLDKAFPPRKMVTQEVEQAAEKLKNDSLNYIDKNKNFANDTDKYTNEDSSAKVMITKRTLIAKKMINKVANEVEGSLKEGAKNVLLYPGKGYSLDKNGMVSLDNAGVRWQDCKNKKLFEHDPIPQDCRQAKLGDCWLQTGLIDILTKKGPEPIKNIFQDLGNGSVRIKLYYPKNRSNKTLADCTWVPKYYTVEKKRPVDQYGKPCYNSGEPWVHYFEAAVAKSNINNKVKFENQTMELGLGKSKTKFRNYSSINGGFTTSVWHMIFGNQIRYNRISQEDITKPTIGHNRKYWQITKALKESKLVYVSFKKFVKIDGNGLSANEAMSKGLVAGHAYTVCGYEEKGGIRYLRLINPWGTRMGRMNGQAHKFEKEGDESFSVKFSTVLKHLYNMTIEK